MSDTLSGGIQVVKTPLPATNLTPTTEKVWSVVESSKNVLYSEYSVPSYSQNSFNYNFIPPSYEAITDSCVLLRQSVNVTATGTTTGSNLWESGFFGLRSYPLSSCMSNLNVQFNGNSISIQPSKVFKDLQRYYYTQKECSVLNTMSPCILDNCVDYNDYVGSINNVLGASIDQSINGMPPRGAFAIDGSTFVNTTTDLNVDFTLTEPLPLSPFCLKNSNSWLDRGFARLRQFTVNVTWESDKQRFMFSNNASSGTTWTTFTVTLGPPTLLIGTYELFTQQPIPKTLEYDWNEIDYYEQNGQNMATGTEQTINSGNLEFVTIPKWIVVLVQRNDNNLTWEDTDSYLNIKNINCKVGNLNNVLSNMSGQQLFNMNNKNGNSFFTFAESGLQDGDYRLPFISGTTNSLLRPVGTPIKAVFGEDIYLPKEYLQPSVGERLQFSVSVRVRNQYAGTVNSPTLKVIVGYSGIMTITENGVVDFRRSILTMDDVRRAEMADGLTWQSLQPNNYSGGSFLSKLKKVGKFIKDKKLLSKAAKYGDDFGVPGSKQLRAVADVTGTSLVGGQIQSRAQLRRKLK